MMQRFITGCITLMFGGIMASSVEAKQIGLREFAPVEYGGFFYTAHTIVNDSSAGALFLQICG
jgi:hypothetical protein